MSFVRLGQRDRLNKYKLLSGRQSLRFESVAVRLKGSPPLRGITEPQPKTFPVRAITSRDDKSLRYHISIICRAEKYLINNFENDKHYTNVSDLILTKPYKS